MSASLFCHTCGFAMPAQATSCPTCGAAIVSNTEAAPPPVFSFLSLLLLLLISLLSIAWGLPPFWLLSLSLLTALVVIRSILALRQTREERSSNLPAGEAFMIVWRQLVSSAPAAFLLTISFFFLDFIYDSLTNPYGPSAGLGDLVMLGVIACSGTIVVLVWLIRWLLQLRVSRPRQQQKLEQPLAQKVYNRPRP